MDTINSAVNELMQFIFGLICHQDQSVLLRINNEFIPLCPRCIGLHSGFFISLFFLILFNIKSINTQKNYQLIILLIVISTAAIHWFLVKINLLEQDSTLRLITGLISGIGFANGTFNSLAGGDGDNGLILNFGFTLESPVRY